MHGAVMPIHWCRWNTPACPEQSCLSRKVSHDTFVPEGVSSPALRVRAL